MTTMQDRPVAVVRPGAFTLAPARHVPEQPRRARSLGLSELMARRPDLHGVYPPATIAADAILWAV